MLKKEDGDVQLIPFNTSYYRCRSRYFRAIINLTSKDDKKINTSRNIGFNLKTSSAKLIGMQDLISVFAERSLPFPTFSH